MIMTDKKTTLFSINTSYFLRGIAILMVILSHYFEWGMDCVGNDKIAHFVMALGDWGVGIFFFLSGYALWLGYGNKKTDKKYIFKRFKNMYFPYILLATIIALINHSIDSPKAVIKLLIGADYWFIAIILIIYVAFYLVGKLPEEYRVLIMTVFILDMSLWLYIMDYQDFWYTANWAFALGMIVSKYEKKIPFINKGFSVDIKDYVFCFLGKISIYIYVLHSFIYMLIAYNPALENINWYIKLLISILITVAISYLAELLCNIIWGRKKNG